MGEVDPLIPDLCLELLWTDQSDTKPRSAFISEDCVGQRYLCLLMETSLRIIKYEHTNDFASLVFGSCATVSAKDAVPLASLHMILVIDETNSLSIYTGAVHISKVNVTQTTLPLNTTLFKDFSSLNISSQFANVLETPLRRSSLLPSKGHVPLLDDKLAFSPVVSEQSANKFFESDTANSSMSANVLNSIHDVALQRVTVKQSDNSMHRITLPDLWSSSLVSRALAAFRYMLPPEVALQFIARWYSTRNSPGCGDFSAHSEWSLFSRTLLSLIGYDTDKLQATWPLDEAGSHSPAAVQKRAKTTENGSEKDWECMLSSQYHRRYNGDMNEVLDVGWIGSIADDVTEMENNGLNVSAPLFHQLPVIFFSLHLIYEELKCCTLYWDLCILLLPCLYQMAVDLRASSYLYHYWRDFPTSCSPEGPARHLSDEGFGIFILPYYFSDNPPCLLSHVSNIMKGKPPNPFPYIPDVCLLIRSLVLIYCVSEYDCALDDVPIGTFLYKISPANRKFVDYKDGLSFMSVSSDLNIHEKIVLLTDNLGLTNLDVQLLAPGLSVLLMNAQHQCRADPPLGWYASTYR